jgi:DNA-binding transcriptional LysR family regulator
MSDGGRGARRAPPPWTGRSDFGTDLGSLGGRTDGVRDAGGRGLHALEAVDVELLTAFDALFKAGNVTHAAERLGVSQPALSARLARLRELFADRLFIPAPSGRGVLPTLRSAELAPRIASVLDQLCGLLEPVGFDPATSTRTFIIALHENPAVMLSPDLAPRMQAHAPDVRLVLAFPHKERMAELMERGEVDLYIGVRASAEKAWLSRTLFEDAFACAQRKGHPRGPAAPDLDGFCEAAHLLVSSEGDRFSGLVDTALAKLGRRRRVAVSIESYAVAPTIIASSDLLCTLPRRFLQRYEHTLDLLNPPLALPPVEVAAYWHPRLQDDLGHQWLRAQLFAAAAAAGRR